MAVPIPPKHPAVVVVASRAPLEIMEVDTIPPIADEALIHVECIGSTPLSLHQADGGLLISPPHIMSGCFAGTIVQLGALEDPALSEASRSLQIGDKVFGFTWQGNKQRPMQTYITVPVYLLGKVPAHVSMQEAVTVPSNFCTAMHTITKDLDLELPWPLPEGWTPTEANKPILIWGAASSVGQYAVQVLRYWGYQNILAVASGKNHALLEEFGAAACFDYRQNDVVEKILVHVSSSTPGPRLPYIIDCIGSLEGTLVPLSKVAEKGTKVAIMLPVIMSHASSTEAPVYEMDAGKVLVGKWEEGVERRGVRTHFYPDNEFFRCHLQPDIMPAMLEKGFMQPNRRRIVEGKTLLERAERALSLLRDSVGLQYPSIQSTFIVRPVVAYNVT
ncbi:hypothetical protein VMCG_06277 [Cytospora schulzeri]|uniref:Enoyl reductase (ER) domain-containing protein n=1 Tax=Cytospora schulzeri TaxID=448051 RepID=A0A423W9E9_9PEZI|nr:hypothetical protein VMCG_06277 [Valsa malicola]